MTGKMGVYICTGCDIAAAVDVEALRKIAEREYKAAVCKTHPFLCSDVDGDGIDEFVMAVGGGGCISGNAEILKEFNPETRIIAVEPYYVRNVSGGDTSGTHRLEGIGLSFLPSILRRDLIDDVVPVKDEDACLVARSLAKTEGLIGGVTSGARR